MDNLNDTSAPTSLLLAVAVNGTNAKPYPQHTYAWCIAATGRKASWSNFRTGPKNIWGHNDKIFYRALLEALKGSGLALSTGGAPSVLLTIIAPNGSELHRVFQQPLEERRKSHYCKADGEPWGNVELIKLVDAETEALGVVLSARPPESDEERNFLSEVQKESGERWKALRRAIKQDRS